MALTNLPRNSLNKQQLEALRVIATGREDPVYFGEKCLGLTFYPQQKIWLWATTKTQFEKCVALAKEIGFEVPEGFELTYYFRSVYDDLDQHILCTANQIGKTFLTAVKHCWSCYYKIGRDSDPKNFDKMEYKTLNVSPHSDQANKCKEYVQNLFSGRHVYFDPETGKLTANEIHPAVEGFVRGGNANLGEISFANGAFFYSKSTGQDKGTARAGEQFGYISYDECAQSRHLKDELPMLQSRILRYGYCFDLISSPESGKPSHLYYSRMVKRGVKIDRGWWGFTGIEFTENVYIDPGQKKKSMQRIIDTDPEKAKQMLRGLFISTGDKFLTMEAVQQIFDGTPKIEQIEMGVKGRKYLITADWGMSDTGDKTVFFVIDYTDWTTKGKVYIVNHQVIKGGSPTMQFAALRVLFNNFGGHGKKDESGEYIWHPVKLITDSNSLGGVIIKKMLVELKPFGFGSKGDQKDQMLSEAYKMLNHQRKYTVDSQTGEVNEGNADFGQVRGYYISQLEEQLGVYKVDDKDIEQDMVMSLFMGLWFISKRLPKTSLQKFNLNPNSAYNEMMSVEA